MHIYVRAGMHIGKWGDVKMYIPEFVCGIVATLIVEIIAAIIYAIHNNKK